MSRAHLLRPVLDANGNVLSDIHVKVYEPGTTSLISESIYLDGTTVTEAQQPMTFPNGVISIYLDVSRRVRVGVQRGVDQEVFFEDIDVLAPSTDFLTREQADLLYAPKPTTEAVTDPETGSTTTLVPSFSVQAIVSGALTVSNNVVPPGLRVVKASTARFLVAHIGTPPTGGPVTVHYYRVNGGTTTALGDVTIAAGQGAGSTAVNVACAKGDMIRFDVTAVGSTVAGSDLNLSVDFE